MVSPKALPSKNIVFIVFVKGSAEQKMVCMVFAVSVGPLFVAYENTKRTAQRFDNKTKKHTYATSSHQCTEHRNCVNIALDVACQGSRCQHSYATRARRRT